MSEWFFVSNVPAYRTLDPFPCLLGILRMSYGWRERRDSVVDIATGYRLDVRGLGVCVSLGSRIFSSPPCPDRHWDPPNLSNGYQGLFPWGESGRGVDLNTHLRPVQRSRKCGSIHPLPNTPSWRSALIVYHKDNSTFLFTYGSRSIHHSSVILYASNWSKR
jgi:hypothetical protein